MTIKELYEWAKERNAENYDICLNYTGTGKVYVIEPKINEDKKDIEL